MIESHSVRLRVRCSNNDTAPNTDSRNLIIIEQVYVCMFVCLYVCMFVCLYVCLFVCFVCYVTPPRALNLGRETFRVSSTTPRSGHLRPHGRVIYDPTVESSTTPQSGSFCVNPAVTLSTNNRITAV